MREHPCIGLKNTLILLQDICAAENAVNARLLKMLNATKVALVLM